MAASLDWFSRGRNERLAMERVGGHTPRKLAGRRIAVASFLVLWLAGCATVEKPYVFLEQGLAPPASASAPLPATVAGTSSLPNALALAREAQRQWAESARGEADRKRGVSAGLIGLSAIALIMGVSSPNAKDLAGLGAAGAALYAWGSVMTSSARNAIYREGIATMACAVEAVSPYEALGWVGQGAQTVEAQIKAAETAKATLTNEARKMRRLNITTETWVPGRSMAAHCAPLKTPTCTGTAANSIQARLCEQLKADPACTPRVATTATEKPHPDLVTALQEADDEQTKIRAAIQDTQVLEGQAAIAGPWLWSTGIAIEKRVREGIEKTEPDLATVLSVSQALTSPQPPKQADKQQTPPSEPIGDSHSTETKNSAGKVAARPAGLDDLRDAISESAAARQALEGRNAQLRGALAAARSESCKRVQPLALEQDAQLPTTKTAPPAITGTPKVAKGESTNTQPAELPATSNR